MSRFVSLILLSLVAALGAHAGPAAAASVVPDPDTRWGCYPGAADNPCEGSLDTTYLANTTLQPRRVSKIERPPAPTAADQPVDCFYVYPTVTGQARSNAPKALIQEVRFILQLQAARFSQVCKVYAPLYRQSTLGGLAGPISEAINSSPPTVGPSPVLDLAYSDVLGAWRDYLANDNDGRGVVLIGHSQGTFLLTRLIAEEIDGNPELRSKLVSAILPGGNVTVKKGERTGGDFANVPTCAAGDEAGCVVAWSTFVNPPGATSLFGRITAPLRLATGFPYKPDAEVACVNPAVLSGDGGRLSAITRSEPLRGLVGAAIDLMFYGLRPTASTAYVVPGERFISSCRRNQTKGGGEANVLRARPANLQTIAPFESPYPDWGLHLADVNFTLGNLLKLVPKQIAAWQAEQGSAG